MAIVNGITTLDMSGTTEVSGLTITPVPAGTKIISLRADATLVTAGNITIRAWENYKQYDTMVTVVPGEFLDLAMKPLDYVPLSAIDQLVFKVEPTAGGGVATPFVMKAITEDLAAGSIDTVIAKLPSKDYLSGSDDADGGMDTEAKADVNAEADTAIADAALATAANLATANAALTALDTALDIFLLNQTSQTSAAQQKAAQNLTNTKIGS